MIGDLACRRPAGGAVRSPAGERAPACTRAPSPRRTSTRIPAVGEAADTAHRRPPTARTHALTHSRHRDALARAVSARTKHTICCASSLRLRC